MATARAVRGKPLAPITRTETIINIRPVGRPISVNSAYGRRGRHTFKTPEAHMWIDAVQASIMDWRQDQGLAQLGPLPYAAVGKIGLDCVFYGTKADADNLLKLTQDTIASALGLKNDSQFLILGSKTEPKVKPAGAHIVVYLTLADRLPTLQPITSFRRPIK